MKTVSEQCSAFLTEQLRVIKVPRIESTDKSLGYSGKASTLRSGYEYVIDNIDLSSCSVSKACLPF